MNRADQSTSPSNAAAPVAAMLGRHEVLALSQADVLAVREASRRRRLITMAVLIGLPSLFLWYRIAIGKPFNVFRITNIIPRDPILIAPLLLLVGLAGYLVFMFVGNRKSPHVMYRPEQIDIGLGDVKGLHGVVDEVVRTLNVFLGYATFRDKLGGNPRRGVLFEGPPGTGKTHLAKAMAKHAGVPFLYVSGPAFQSMWYGATAAKIRTFFKALKKTARREGGAIGFIEEIDAFATARGSMESSTAYQTQRSVFGNVFGGRRTEQMIAQGTGGTVNELLIQMQSFDSLPFFSRFLDKVKEYLNGFLPAEKGFKKKTPPYSNVLIIAATNRGDSLDPALLRPGRFDRRLYFDPPSRAGRRELVDYFLDKKSHDSVMDESKRRDDLAGLTFGYTPVMIEHLLDEALIVALRHGRDQMCWDDIMDAKMTTEIGMPNPVSYTPFERAQIATHEAGHAVTAYLIGEGRTLEILSIIKRRDALGLLGHSESEERFTKTRSELEALVRISLGGLVAEEMFFGESGTGPAGDLAGATGVAAEMVGSLGMAGSLISFRAVGESMFDSGLVGRVLGNPEARKAVDRILDLGRKEVTALLKKNRGLVEALRDALMDRDELIGADIIEVLEAAGGASARKSLSDKATSSKGRARKAASTN
ncbi:MAG: AAA family ATPase [Actinomycetota bacterium]